MAPDHLAQERVVSELPDHSEHHDLIDEPVLPRLGLELSTLIAIFLGGGFGTVARYLVDRALPHGPGGFPTATLLVNLTGSLLIGLLIPLTEHLTARVAQVRPFVIVGALGGWTTYSTLAVDAVQLAQHHRVGVMLGYLAATVVGGIIAVLVGNAVGHRVVPP